jgi:hypothetical protein
MPSWSWAGWEGQAHYLHTFYSLAKPGVYEFHPEITLIEVVQSMNIPQLPGESNGNNMAQSFNSVLQFEAWIVPGDIFTYVIEEQHEQTPSSKYRLDDTIDHAVLTCAIFAPNTESYAEKTQCKKPALEASQANIASGAEDSSDDEGEKTIGVAWLTHGHSPLHETVQEGEYSWVLLAREQGFMGNDRGFTTRPDDFPEEWLTQNDSDEEDRDPPWMAQLMLVKWDQRFAQRIALAYIETQVWDGIVAEKGEKRVIFLV